MCVFPFFMRRWIDTFLEGSLAGAAAAAPSNTSSRYRSRRSTGSKRGDDSALVAKFAVATHLWQLQCQQYHHHHHHHHQQQQQQQLATPAPMAPTPAPALALALTGVRRLSGHLRALCATRPRLHATLAGDRWACVGGYACVFACLCVYIYVCICVWWGAGISGHCGVCVFALRRVYLCVV